jgi:hypothetical protein
LRALMSAALLSAVIDRLSRVRDLLAVPDCAGRGHSHLPPKEIK